MPLAHHGVHAAVVGRCWSRLPCSPCSVVARTHRPVTHPAPIPQSWATPTAIASSLHGIAQLADSSWHRHRDWAGRSAGGRPPPQASRSSEHRV